MRTTKHAAHESTAHDAMANTLMSTWVAGWVGGGTGREVVPMRALAMIHRYYSHEHLGGWVGGWGEPGPPMGPSWGLALSRGAPRPASEAGEWSRQYSSRQYSVGVSTP